MLGFGLTGLAYRLLTGEEEIKIPIVSDLMDTAEAGVDAIESFSQLFIHLFSLQTANNRPSPSKALLTWSSIPIAQLAAIVAIGAPTMLAAGYSSPRIIEGVPNAFKTLSTIDYSFSPKQRKQLRLLKYGAFGLGGLLLYRLIQELGFQFWLKNEGVTQEQVTTPEEHKYYIVTKAESTATAVTDYNPWTPGVHPL